MRIAQFRDEPAHDGEIDQIADAGELHIEGCDRLGQEAR